MAIDWKIRAEVLADPDHSDAVKRAMMHFWLTSDRYEAEPEKRPGEEIIARFPPHKQKSRRQSRRINGGKSWEDSRHPIGGSIPVRWFLVTQRQTS